MPRARAHPLAVIVLVAVVWVVGLLVATSDLHGAGARDVGTTAAARAEAGAGGTCPATVTLPGGRNNYRAGAEPRTDLGTGFVVEGVVRGTDCAPLPGVRLQIWAQTAAAGERTNRAAVRTGPDGTYRLTTDPLSAQFGELNIHVAHDGSGNGAPDPYRSVFVRHVVAPGSTGARVDLVLLREDA